MGLKIKIIDITIIVKLISIYGLALLFLFFISFISNILFHYFIIKKIKVKLPETLDSIKNMLNDNIKILSDIQLKIHQIDINTSDLNYVISLNHKILNKYKNEIIKLRENIYNLSEAELLKLLDEIENIEKNIEIIIQNISIINEALEGNKWEI